MKLPEYRAAYKPFKDAVNTLLVAELGCGPFDGGCVVCALALQRVIGGTVMVLMREDGFADHAALLYRGKLLDMDGPLTPSRFLARFNRVAMRQCTSYRPFASKDLPEASRDAKLVDKLAGIFAQFLAPEMDSRTIARVRAMTNRNATTEAYMTVSKRLGLPKLYESFSAIAEQQRRDNELSRDNYHKRYALYSQMIAYAGANLPLALYNRLRQAL